MSKGLWEPPRLRVSADNEEERRATWLELFFDLIFVVAIAELAHYLDGHVGLSGFFSFVALFVPTWWCWLGSTFYATRFDTDDLGHRLLTLLQMALVAALAVNVHHGLGESVVAVVKGVAQKEWDVASVVAALLGLSIAFSLWWIYFDSVDGSPLKSVKAGKIGIAMTWLYAHLPLAIGLAATGVGVDQIIASQSGVLPIEARWLFCGAVALCLSVLALIHLITCTLGTTRRRKILSAYRLGAAIFILMLAAAGSGLSSLVLVALVAFACVLQVVLNLLFTRKAKTLTEEVGG